LRRISRAEEAQPVESVVVEVEDVYIPLRREEEAAEEGVDQPRFPTEPGDRRRPTERYEPKERGKNR
jgi:hypothetical protein